VQGENGTLSSHDHFNWYMYSFCHKFSFFLEKKLLSHGWTPKLSCVAVLYLTLDYLYVAKFAARVTN
jgi:hypothetical protein